MPFFRHFHRDIIFHLFLYFTFGVDGDGSRFSPPPQKNPGGNVEFNEINHYCQHVLAVYLNKRHHERGAEKQGGKQQKNERELKCKIKKQGQSSGHGHKAELLEG